MRETRIGIVTIGQSPRVDVVPDMLGVLGPGVDIVERGALDGLDGGAVEALAPRPGDDILVTRLHDGRPVFVGKLRILDRLAAAVADVEAHGVVLTVLLCTGAFPPLRGARPLLAPQPVLLGVLRGLAVPGRLGVVTPSVPHVPQTRARWQADGFDPVVVPLSPYEEDRPGALAEAARALRDGGAGLVVLDCMGFRGKTRDELAALTGGPVLVASLLVARVAAELCGSRLPGP